MPDIDRETGKAVSNALLKVAFKTASVSFDDSCEEWQLDAVENALDEILMSVATENKLVDIVKSAMGELKW